MQSSPIRCYSRRPLTVRSLSISMKTSGLAAGCLLLGPPIAAAFSSSSALSSLSLGPDLISRTCGRNTPPRVSFSLLSPPSLSAISLSSSPNNKLRSFRFRYMSSSLGTSASDSDGDDPTSTLASTSAASASLPTKWSDVTNINSSWNKYTNNLFPPLTASSHKGSHGRIAIFGGSEKYTGAPYYAAQSALNCGIDLVTIFCAQEAAIPIKCYSPELMVQSVYSIQELDALLAEETQLLKELEQCKQRSINNNSDDTNNNNNGDNGVVLTNANKMNELELMQTMEKLEQSKEKQHLLIQSNGYDELLQKKNVEMELLAERLVKMKEIDEKLHGLRKRQEDKVSGIVDTITAVFPTLHALCVGPGLGRHPLVFSAVEQVLRKAMESNIPVVLDADALFMLSLKEYRSLFVQLSGYERCVMTPNLMEMRRLSGNNSIATAISVSGDNDDASGESSHNSNIVVQKGSIDTIIYGHEHEHGGVRMECKEQGGLKRSGGIGDVLAGTISAFMAWNAILQKDALSNNNKNFDGGGVAMDRQHEQHQQQRQRIFASWSACVVLKRATNIAYQKKRRAMSAVDVIGEIGEVIDNMEGGLK